MHSSSPGFGRISTRQEKGLEALSALVLGARREGLAEARDKERLKETLTQGEACLPSCMALCRPASPCQACELRVRTGHNVQPTSARSRGCSCACCPPGEVGSRLRVNNIASNATAQEVAEFLERQPHGSRVLSARLHADNSGRESGPLHRSFHGLNHHLQPPVIPTACTAAPGSHAQLCMRLLPRDTACMPAQCRRAQHSSTEWHTTILLAAHELWSGCSVVIPQPQQPAHGIKRCAPERTDIQSYRTGCHAAQCAGAAARCSLRCTLPQARR